MNFEFLMANDEYFAREHRFDSPWNQAGCCHSEFAIRNSKFGFTLVEILIAIAILSGLMLAIYSSWAAILRGSKIGLDAAVQAQRSRMAIRCLQDALFSAQLFTGNIAYYAFFTDTSADFAALSLVAYLPKSFPGSGFFGDQPVRRVTFAVEPGEGGNQLVMRQSPILQAIDPTEDAFPIVLATNVSVFALEFWPLNGREWLTEWIPTNQLPAQVRISLAFGSTRNLGPEDVYTRIVALPAMAVPRVYQVQVQPIVAQPIQPGQPGQPGGPGVQANVFFPGPGPPDFYGGQPGGPGVQPNLPRIWGAPGQPGSRQPRQVPGDLIPLAPPTPRPFPTNPRSSR